MNAATLPASGADQSIAGHSAADLGLLEYAMDREAPEEAAYFACIWFGDDGAPVRYVLGYATGTAVTGTLDEGITPPWNDAALEPEIRDALTRGQAAFERPGFRRAYAERLARFQFWLETEFGEAAPGAASHSLARH